MIQTDLASQLIFSKNSLFLEENFVNLNKEELDCLNLIVNSIVTGKINEIDSVCFFSMRNKLLSKSIQPVTSSEKEGSIEAFVKKHFDINENDRQKIIEFSGKQNIVKEIYDKWDKYELRGLRFSEYLDLYKTLLPGEYEVKNEIFGTFQCTIKFNSEKELNQFLSLNLSINGYELNKKNLEVKLIDQDQFVKAVARRLELEFTQYLTEEELLKYKDFEIRLPDMIYNLSKDKDWSRFVLNETSSIKELKKFVKFNQKLVEPFYRMSNAADIEENWETCVVKKPGFSKFYYKNYEQKKYGKMMYQSVKAAAEYIRQTGVEGNVDFDDLIRFLSFRRRYIAKEFASDSWDRNWTDFGRKQTQPWKTPLMEDYSQIAPRLKERLVNSPTDKIQVQSNKRLDLIENINGEQVTLSQYKLTDESTVLSKYQKEHNYTGDLEHTRKGNSDKVMKYVKEVLFPEAINEEDPEKVTENLGKMFWWICQAKPWKRGDPSIAESLIRAIWLSKGMENPPWKEGVIPWVEVSVEPEVDLFSKNFNLLFDWKKAEKILMI